VIRGLWIACNTELVNSEPTRRDTFDQVAELYHEARPGYPGAIFDDVLSFAALPSPAQLFEIGCGTGHATIEFARRGFAIDCVELGPNLADLARRNLESHPRVSITLADFDNFAANSRYHLVYSASAYHWLNPATRIARIAELLHPAGCVAVWRNHDIRGKLSARFHDAAQAIYAAAAPDLVNKHDGVTELSRIPFTESEQWLASGLFRDAQTRVYLWQRKYTAEEHVRVLDTYSDHRMLAADARAKLFAGLRSLIKARFNDSITREFATILQSARKR
jgi:trans-aconitate methyltransferase